MVIKRSVQNTQRKPKHNRNVNVNQQTLYSLLVRTAYEYYYYYYYY